MGRPFLDAFFGTLLIAVAVVLILWWIFGLMSALVEGRWGVLAVMLVITVVVVSAVAAGVVASDDSELSPPAPNVESPR